MITQTNDPRYQTRLKLAIAAALLMLLFGCGTPYKWVAVPIVTTVENGQPGYKPTGKPIPVHDSMGGKRGYIFKKIKY